MPITPPNLTEIPDEFLLERARHGDERAFLVLFGRHRDVIFRLAYRLTDAEAAEDITQECCLGLLTSSSRFDPSRGSLRTYLYAVVRNLARKRYWMHHSDVELDDAAVEPAVADEPEPVRLLLHREVSLIVQEAVASLPLPQREAFVLFQYEELRLEEIATILDIEVGTVKSRLHRARVRLRKTLTPYFTRSNSDVPSR